MIVQPGGVGFDPIGLIVLIQALLIAFSVVIVKRFPARESQLSMMFFTFVSSGLFSCWFAVDNWVTLDLHQALLLLGVAAAGIIAQAMVLRAYRLGEASFIAPLSYIRLIFAGTLGAIWFAEFPRYLGLDRIHHHRGSRALHRATYEFVGIRRPAKSD